MPNAVRISVDGADDLLNASMYGAGAVVRVQSATTETGTYASVGTAALVSGTRIYVVYHTAGTSTDWYRTRYESSGGAITSDWSAAFQVGPEEAGGLCSLYDVKQALNETGTTYDEEIQSLIDEFTADVQEWTRRRFVRYPLAGTTTVVLDVPRSGRALRIPQGIATLTTLEVATESQPGSGGTYTTATASDWMLRPASHDRLGGWPATEIVIRDNATGPVSTFFAGRNAARLSGAALGWDRVPPTVSGIARRAIVRRFKNRGAASVNRGGDPSDINARWTLSLEDQRRLEWYRLVTV